VPVPTRQMTAAAAFSAIRWVEGLCAPRNSTPKSRQTRNGESSRQIFSVSLVSSSDACCLISGRDRIVSVRVTMKPLWNWIKGPLGQVLLTILSLLVLFVLARYYRNRETSTHTVRIQKQGERGTGGQPEEKGKHRSAPLAPKGMPSHPRGCATGISA
jgi:hypothetical protein